MALTERGISAVDSGAFEHPLRARIAAAVNVQASRFVVVCIFKSRVESWLRGGVLPVTSALALIYRWAWPEMQHSWLFVVIYLRPTR